MNSHFDIAVSLLQRGILDGVEELLCLADSSDYCSCRFSEADLRDSLRKFDSAAAARLLLFSMTRTIRGVPPERWSSYLITGPDVVWMSSYKDRRISIELAAVAASFADRDDLYVLLREGGIEEPEIHPLSLLQSLPDVPTIELIPFTADRTAWAAWEICLQGMWMTPFPRDMVLHCWRIAIERGHPDARYTLTRCRADPQSCPSAFSVLRYLI